ncbi:sigma-70 family RNA polymerase sigma factor [Enterococcus faecium]|uniref:sigma-70 family RNA polymerase sigma factor n=1 Tax=Enterococcus faecium TaxID=1352 RepID=UPI001586AA1C|nr:sigma-70 family RNA polymerase sigma factor [Enterococcus faecium]
MEKTYLFIRYIQKTLLHEKLNYVRNNKKRRSEILIEDEFLHSISSCEKTLLEDIKLEDINHFEDYIENNKLANSLTSLTDVEKFILFKRYVRGNNDTEIAKEFNVTSQAISKRRRNILNKIKNKFQV